MITELLVLAVTGFIIYWLTTRRPKNYPPGPTGWPIVGNLFQISRDIPRHRQFAELGKKYGDIVGLYFADRPIVVLNNYKHIKEAFAENVFSGRVISHLTLIRNLGGNRGLLLSEGRPWQEQRRFTLKTLRDFGFGKKSMEALIMEEVNELISGFKKEVGKPIITQNRFNIAVLNGLWLLLTGNKFSHDDPRLNFLVKSVTSVITRRPISALVAEFFPSVQKIRALVPGFFNTQGLQTHQALQTLIRETIDEHKATLQEDAPRDFIDAFLIESNKTTDKVGHICPMHDCDRLMITDVNVPPDLGLHIVLVDLFIAGAETTSTTLTWTFLTMALHPEKQEKLYEEIKRVVGLSRSVSLTDRADLPYLEACIMEMLRFSAVVATGVFHRTHEEVQFQGYTIPKHTTVIANIFNANHDTSAWGDAQNFRPERFITPEGKCLVRNDAFMPFSVGKRICLGETLAKDELFLFMGNLFQQFKVTTYDGEPKPTFEPLPSFVLFPQPHKVVLVDRNSG